MKLCVDTASLVNDVYERFIKTAFRRSDLISIRVDWPNEHGFLSKEESLKRGITETFYNACLMSYNAHIVPNIMRFNEYKLPFLQKLEPYFMDGDTLSDKKWVYHIYPSEDILPLFLSVGSLDAWKYPYYPEDLSFAKSGEFWFNSISHDGFAQITLANDEDFEFWKKLGVLFEDC